MSTTERLGCLRSLMAQHGLSAYIVPSEDAHQSEYLADCDKRRAYISNFDGSAGIAVVLQDKAALWTDGRYFLQASEQLDHNWTLMRAGLPETPRRDEWIKQSVPSGRVGIDPLLVSAESAQAMAKQFGSQLELVQVPANLVDEVWAGRPARQLRPICAFGDEFSGRPLQEKVHDLRAWLKKEGHEALLLTSLDEIAWLLNLRGADIPFNPVFFAYLLVSLESAALFVEKDCLQPSAKETLAGISICDYGSVTQHLTDYAPQLLRNAKTMAVTRSCNWLLHSVVAKASTIVDSPVESAKAAKNAVEIDGFRNCHIRDGAAVCEFVAWLENQVGTGADLDEVDAADRLETFRSAQPHFKGLSFETISAVGKNGAVIHYKPEKETCAKITADQLYLLDSGGQYLDGTTDITRTMHFGTPTDFEREAFTLVLKGNISLNMAVFPPKTSGPQLDAIARLPLWRLGLDYLHGTGHGVGHFLNVHEGPHSISGSVSTPSASVKLVPGMMVTNEPGYYHAGSFGIRIENVMVVKPAATAHQFNNAQFLAFECLTMVPIQLKMIKKELLSTEEIDWLNQYHALVRRNVSPLLKNNKRALDWLAESTRSI